MLEFEPQALVVPTRLLVRHTTMYYIVTRRKAVITAPISVRLDDDLRETLAAEARARHIRLSTYIRQIAIEAAMRLRRERIHAQSRAVGEHVASSAEAAAFYEEWGTPRLEDK